MQAVDVALGAVALGERTGSGCCVNPSAEQTCVCLCQSGQQCGDGLGRIPTWGLVGVVFGGLFKTGGKRKQLVCERTTWAAAW